MNSKTIFLAILLAVAVCNCNVYGKPNAHRVTRSNNIFFDLMQPLAPMICTGCPQHYCDTDPGIILGYCCGCRRALDILPIRCPTNVFCPASLRDVCHDYEYMLNCCC